MYVLKNCQTTYLPFLSLEIEMQDNSTNERLRALKWVEVN